MEQMTLSELKTGMHVVTKNGAEWVVLRDTLFREKDVIISATEDENNNGNWLGLSIYNENLTVKNKEFDMFDIIRVYQPKYEFTALEYKLDCCCEDWSIMLFAEETMTKAEAEEKLGVRIVD